MNESEIALFEKFVAIANLIHERTMTEPIWDSIIIKEHIDWVKEGF